MPINANLKFSQAILNGILGYELITCKNINEEELEKKLKKGVGIGGYNIKLINKYYEYINSKAKEYTYENGIIYLDSEITYKDKKHNNDIKTIRQITVTTNYEKPPIVNIIIEIDKKSIQELLINTESNNNIIKDSDKNIQEEKLNIYVDNKWESVFEKYTDLSNNSVLIEKYKQYYPVTKSKKLKKDLLKLCGFGDRYLEIMYDNNKPVYAQIYNLYLTDEKKYKIEKLGLNPNSQKDVKIVVEIINKEVNNISEKISTTIKEQINNNKEQKTNKKKVLIKK